MGFVVVLIGDVPLEDCSSGLTSSGAVYCILPTSSNTSLPFLTNLF